jgi:secreted PhoX family phosphatase
MSVSRRDFIGGGAASALSIAFAGRHRDLGPESPSRRTAAWSSPRTATASGTSSAPRARASRSRIGRNAFNDGELTGVTFADDGCTLFANRQEPGVTFAITGPWQHIRR